MSAAGIIAVITPDKTVELFWVTAACCFVAVCAWAFSKVARKKSRE